MDAKARRALKLIRECVARKRYLVLPHFVQHLDQRGFCLPDVLVMLEGQANVRSDGNDEFQRPKWVVSGETHDGLALDVVCVLDTDERGRVMVLVALY